MRHDVINSEMSYNSASHSLMVQECYNQVVVLNKRKEKKTTILTGEGGGGRPGSSAEGFGLK